MLRDILEMLTHRFLAGRSSLLVVFQEEEKERKVAAFTVQQKALKHMAKDT